MEEALLITAIASSIDGIETHNIGETACSDDARRRRRDLLGSSDSVSIDFVISISTSNLDDSVGTSELSTSLISALATAVSSGELSTNLAAAAADSGFSSPISAATVTSAGASTHAPTPGPALPPSPPIEPALSGAGHASVGIASAVAVMLALVVSCAGTQ